MNFNGSKMSKVFKYLAILCIVTGGGFAPSVYSTNQKSDNLDW